MRPLVLFVALCASSAWAQAPMRTSDLVAWTVATEAASRGGVGRVVLRATIAPGWRLYALGSPVGRPMTLDVETLPPGVEASAVQQAEPRQGFDEAFGQTYPYFAGTAEVSAPLRVARGARRGRHVVAGRVSYAICDDSICLPPVTTPFRTTLVVR